MSDTARRRLTAATLPTVACRAALGVGVMLLVLHTLTAGTGTTSGEVLLTSEQAGLRLDPNLAAREELMLLPRVGPTIADYIVEYRASVRAGRAFRRAEDLDNVPRIGPVTVAQLRPFLRFAPARGAATAAEVTP